MKAKNLSGGSRGLSVPKMTVESQRNGRSGNEKEFRMEDTTVFPPLRVDQGVDPKIPISHSIQEDQIGIEGQVTGFRDGGFTGEQMGANVQRTIFKLPSENLS